MHLASQDIGVCTHRLKNPQEKLLISIKSNASIQVRATQNKFSTVTTRRPWLVDSLDGSSTGVMRKSPIGKKIRTLFFFYFDLPAVLFL